MLDSWDSYKGALRDLANAAQLTIVVGAGASLQSGLPTWRKLVERLLSAGAAQQGLRGREIREFAEWVINRDDLIPAASVARDMLGKKFETALRQALYQDASSPAPGMTARAAAALRLMLDHRSEIATTNYDVLLEDASREAVANTTTPKSPPTVVSLVDASVPSRKEVAVRHLHGLLKPKGGAQGKLVLSEADYHLMQQADQWQEQYFGERLNSGPCLFVGASLTDPNLLRYLYRTGSGRKHYAVFARQQDADAYLRAPASVRSVRERTAEERWAHMGITPLQFDHYAETPQFLWEIVLRRRHGTSYVPLKTRLAEWEAWATRTFLPRSSNAFWQVQDRLRALLREALDLPTAEGEAKGLRPARNERLQCSLWINRPSRDALVNIGSSDRAWRDKDTLQPVKVRWHSDFAAIQAFCAGSTVSHRTDTRATTRWNHILGQALYEMEGRHNCLPVGVVTWASTWPEDRSFLQQVRTRMPDLLDEMGNVLAFMLTPADT